jgi:transcriptional regulator with XRE-family HTH domain
VTDGDTKPPTTLADKINKLFTIIRTPDGAQHTNNEVAVACRETTGESFSATYLWQLRTGRRENPTKRHLEALATFFDVPVAYFFDDNQGKQIQAELELLAALRNAEVCNVALRAANLSPEGLGMVKDIIDTIVKREANRRADGRHS